jgi:hypothetical protein
MKLQLLVLVLSVAAALCACERPVPRKPGEPVVPDSPKAAAVSHSYGRAASFRLATYLHESTPQPPQRQFI